MKSTQPLREEILIGVIALAIACVLAANQVTGGGVAGWLRSYAYWIPRIAMEAALFFMALVAIEKYASNRLSNMGIAALAFLISLVPFTLAITSFDLIVGLPELGINTSEGQPNASLAAFAKELFYLFDNHLALCIALLLPGYLRRKQNPRPDDNTAPALVTNDTAAPSFIDSIDPPLDGRITWVEAQEHYVRITTTTERRMVLHRFTDAIRDLPAASGMQVHRSHWVAFTDIKALIRDGQKTKLLLKSGDYVPVSRSYRQQAEQKFQSLNGKQNS